MITKDRIKKSIIKQKKIYIALCSLIAIGMIVGAIFVFVLADTDKSLVSDKLTSFFMGIANNKIDYVSGIQNSLLNNLCFCLGIFLLGISIVGIPIIVILVFMKGFVFGFSLVMIINMHGFSGIPVGLTYVFFAQLIMLVVSILLSFYAIKFSARLFSSLFLKKEINFKEVMSKYLRVLFICLGISFVNSFIEVFISPLLIKLFVDMIL